MDNYYGLIQVENIQNIFPDVLTDQDEEVKLSDSHTRFVHYPDCQQLIVWLPEHYRFYDRFEIKDSQSENIVYVEKISQIVSGSVQILIDTLFLPPGKYEITISKNDGLRHIVFLLKYPEGQMPSVAETAPTEPPDLDSPPIIYRDGFGNILPNEDMILREKIITKTIDKITRRVEYVNQGRDGKVIYIEGDKRITFLMEMGAYDCVFYVNIPTAKDWEEQTKFPLSEREEIITFVAAQTQRDQASSCVYKVTDREISYYRERL